MVSILVTIATPPGNTKPAVYMMREGKTVL